MQLTLHVPDNLPLAYLLQKVREFEDLMKTEALALPSTTTVEKPTVDVLQVMAQMAQPMGITDLSHRFDDYTKSISFDDLAA